MPALTLVGPARQRVHGQRKHEVAVAIGVEAGLVDAIEDVGSRGAQAGLVGHVRTVIALWRIVDVAAGSLLQQGEHRQAGRVAG